MLWISVDVNLHWTFPHPTKSNCYVTKIGCSWNLILGGGYVLLLLLYAESVLNLIPAFL